jgi:hypothetical protein
MGYIKSMNRMPNMSLIVSKISTLLSLIQSALFGLVSMTVCLCIGSETVLSEQHAYSDSIQYTQHDSLAPLSPEAILYEIRFTRLQRLVPQFLQDHPDTTLPAVILEFLNDAKQLAEQGSYDLATELLEEVVSFFETEASTPNNPANYSIDNGTNETPQSSSDWTKYVFFGSDFWEQKFNLALGKRDSTILEGEGNPFVGLRVRLDHAYGTLSQTLAEIEAKHSRDYLTGRLLLDHRQQVSGAVHTKFENRFEATSYSRDSDLRYIDDQLDLGLFVNLNNANSFELRNEIQVRDYANETDLYTSFLQNRAIATISMAPFGMSHIDVDFDYRNRHHNLDPQKDYYEHRICTEAWYGVASAISTLLAVQWRARRYKYPDSEDLLTKNFNQFYSELDFRLTLAHNLTLTIDGDLEIRNYREPSTVIPNYWELALQPSFGVNLGAPCLLRFGYYFKTRQHSAASNKNSVKVEIENYYAHGPSITVDVFTLGGFVMSVTDIYEFRRYPNSISKGISDFSLYSDRNVNSLFLFFSWNFTKRWELDVIANLDHDNDTEDDNGDSRTTLCTLELAYQF